ncbi:sigma-70 family RNA polymerase sigma factor [Streptomyces diacarni]|uniref:RNA polymerase sigma factor n=1 Tax=Streptomyces diacarni TaxID=2800381 RepID=UPI0026ADEAD5
MTHPSPESDLLQPRLRALLDAECAAEAAALPGAEAADLRQGVWLRWLLRTRGSGPPAEPGIWLREAVSAEARAVRDRLRRELPRDAAPPPHRVPPQRRVTAADGRDDPASEVEAPLLSAESRRELSGAVARLPGRCPALLRALLSGVEPTYAQIARELDISQGAVGPLRSRCLQCLRRMLAAQVPPPGLRGRVREDTSVTRADSTGAAPSHPRARAHTTWGGMRTWA